MDLACEGELYFSLLPSYCIQRLIVRGTVHDN